MDPIQLQVLRTLDKADKVSPPDLAALLTGGLKDSSGAFIQGCGLSAAQAVCLVAFVSGGLVEQRVCLIDRLENTIVGAGETAWDRLLAMPANADQTWSDGGRPANIGWALDDLCEWLTTAAPAERT